MTGRPAPHEAAARAWFDRQQSGRLDAGRHRPDGQPWRWEDLTEDDQRAYLAVVTPIVDAAAADIRALLKSRIAEVVAVFDAHDPGIYLAADIDATEDHYKCPDACPGFIGTKAEWEQHLAEKLADALEAT